MSGAGGGGVASLSPGSLQALHVCVHRLEGVETRLQETSEAFEQSRVVAKRAKSEYERVKKMRYTHNVPVYTCTHDNMCANVS